MRQPIGVALPGVAAVLGLPHRSGRLRHEPSAVRAVERDDPERLRVARMGDQREPEVARQPVGAQVRPGETAVGRAVHPAVVLLVERLGLVGGHRELVDALAGDRIPVGVEVRANTAVARLPGCAAVTRLEHADGRDPDPCPRRIRRVRHDRVQDQATGARLPRRAGLVLGEASDVLPGRAAIRAPEEPGWLDAGEDRPVWRRRKAPHGSDRVARRPVAIGQPARAVRPARAEVLAPPDRGAVPRRATGGEDCAAAWLDDEVVDRPALAQRTADVPGRDARHRSRRRTRPWRCRRGGWLGSSGTPPWFRLWATKDTDYDRSR